MSQQSPMNHHYNDDEISLVDLAKIIVKRRWWFFGTLSLGLLLTIAAAYVQKPQPTAAPTTWEYSTLVAIGYKSPRDLLEPAVSVQTQITEAYLPLARRQAPEFANMNVSVSTERDSNLLVLTTRYRADQQALVQSFHEQLVAPLVQRHSELIDMLREEAREGTSLNSGQQLLTTTVPALAVAKPSSSTGGQRSTTLMFLAGVILSGMFAFIVPFGVEFVARVRESLKEDKIL